MALRTSFEEEDALQPSGEIGIPEPHHSLSHHRGNAEWIEKLARIDRFHAELFSYLLAKLKSTPDGDGTLLDHSMIVYGGGLSDSNRHSHEDLPLVLAGGGGGCALVARRHPHRLCRAGRGQAANPCDGGGRGDRARDHNA